MVHHFKETHSLFGWGGQTANRRAALMRTTTAVAKWMPNATAFVPPLRSTITVSPSGLVGAVIERLEIPAPPV